MKRLAIILLLGLLCAGQAFGATWTGYPNGAGDRTEATPSAGANWDCVEETPHDSDGTYVSTNPGASPDEDLYAVQDPTFDATDFINSVTVHIVTRETAAHAGSAAPCLKENGTDTVGSATFLLLTYADYSQTWTARPSDGNNWQYDDIASLQIGVKQNCPPATVVYTTQVRVVVDYTPSIKPQVIIVTGDD